MPVTSKFALVMGLGLTLLCGWLLLSSRQPRPESRSIASTPGLGALVPVHRTTIGVPRVAIPIEPNAPSITGVIQDAAGGIVVGAEVLLVAPDDHDDVVAGALSDSEGRFDIQAPSGVLQLIAEAEGYSRASIETLVPSRGLRLVLVPGATLTGRVVDHATNQSIEGIRVTAYKRSGGVDNASSFTGADGTFQVNVSPGGYELVAVDESWRSTSQWAVAELTRTSEPVVLQAFPAGHLSGIVEVEDRPCMNGLVRLSGPIAASDETDLDGAVEVGGLVAGKYDLRVQCTGAEIVSETFELSAREASVRRRWNLQRGLSIRGRVTTSTGVPAKGEAVSVEKVGSSPAHEGPPGTHCVTTDDGSFRCSGLSSGVYRCFVNGEQGVRSDVVVVSVERARDQPIELRLAPTASIRAHVVSGAGLPAERLEVIARRGEVDIGSAYAVAPGEYLIQALPLGLYEVRVGNQLGSSSTTAYLNRDGDVVSVRLESPPGRGSITGRVVDEQGRPVSDAWVRSAPASLPIPEGTSGYKPCVSDGDGRFAITDVWPGTYRVSASTATGSGEVSDAEPGRTVEVRVRAFGEISGVTQDVRGQPAASFRLTAMGPDGAAAANHVFEPGGRWRLPWLAPGTWRITAENAGNMAVEEIVLQPGQRVHIVLTLADSTDRRSTNH